MSDWINKIRPPERNNVETPGLLMQRAEENGDSVLHFGGLFIQKGGLISAKMGTKFCKTGVYFDISYE